MRTPVVVITGADNGIGFYVTKSLLEDGFHVAALDMSGENVSVLQDTYPDRFRFYRCDVTDTVQVKKSVGSMVQEWSTVDVLVNNACLALFAPFAQRSLDDTRREFEVNYFGYLHMIQAVLPRTLAIEFEPYGIRVNLMHPPLTRTKSATPLGVPSQAMEEPARVGRKLAGKIQSTKSIVTPDFKTALALFLSRHFPEAMGRLMAKMTQKAKKNGG